MKHDLKKQPQKQQDNKDELQEPRSPTVAVLFRERKPRPITWRKDMRYDAVDDDAFNPKRGDVWSLPAFRSSLRQQNRH